MQITVAVAKTRDETEECVPHNSYYYQGMVSHSNVFTELEVQFNELPSGHFAVLMWTDI